jgi:preprotein translocase subunit SecG
MFGLLLTLHILICVGLVIVVLLQSGKGGGLAGGAFGGTAQTVFGGRGATDFMTRATMVLGGAFFLTSLVLALLSSGGSRASRSLIQEEARHAPAAVPQVPGQAPGSTPSQSPGQQQAPSQPAQQAPPPAPPVSPPAGGGGK